MQVLRLPTIVGFAVACVLLFSETPVVVVEYLLFYVYQLK